MTSAAQLIHQSNRHHRNNSEKTSSVQRFSVSKFNPSFKETNDFSEKASPAKNKNKTRSLQVPSTLTDDRTEELVDEVQLSESNTKTFALNLLSKLGLNESDIKKFTKDIGPKGYSALANFAVACEFMEIPTEWGSKQIQAFLIYVNYKYYAASYLERMWKTIQELGKFLLQPISERQEADFELVKNQGKEIKDNKVPVSKQLLAKLCKAADQAFASYNAALAKVLFLSAWGGYMRIGEYSRTANDEEGNKHNLRRDAVITSPAGLSIQFHSDKTSKDYDPMKHRFVPWKDLPKGSRKAFEDYDELRPPHAYNYFCREDGLELNRTMVLNILDTCLVMTNFCYLNLTPHCFRLGAASHDRYKGLPVSEIRDKGRWSPKSKAIEAYTRPDIY